MFQIVSTLSVKTTTKLIPISENEIHRNAVKPLFKTGTLENKQNFLRNERQMNVKIPKGMVNDNNCRCYIIAVSFIYK